MSGGHRRSVLQRQHEGDGGDGGGGRLLAKKDGEGETYS